MKRQIAYFLVVFVGFLALSGHFINYAPLNDFIDNDATQWFDIIAGFAAFLGVIYLLQLHMNKIVNIYWTRHGLSCSNIVTSYSIQKKDVNSYKDYKIFCHMKLV